jgi:hypothetical protein
MWISSGHVEHFISQSACLECDQPHLAYDWANYRYIMPELNSRKGARPPLLDPFEVQEGWFEIVLPQLHLRVTERIPDSSHSSTIISPYLPTHYVISSAPKMMRSAMSYEPGAAS